MGGKSRERKIDNRCGGGVGGVESKDKNNDVKYKNILLQIRISGGTLYYEFLKIFVYWNTRRLWGARKYVSANPAVKIARFQEYYNILCVYYYCCIKQHARHAQTAVKTRGGVAVTLVAEQNNILLSPAGLVFIRHYFIFIVISVRIYVYVYNVIMCIV